MEMPIEFRDFHIKVAINGFPGTKAGWSGSRGSSRRWKRSFHHRRMGDVVERWWWLGQALPSCPGLQVSILSMSTIVYIYIYIHINTHPYIFHHLSDILVFDVYIYICISTLHVYLYLHIYISIQDETAHVGPWFDGGYKHSRSLTRHTQQCRHQPWFSSRITMEAHAYSQNAMVSRHVSDLGMEFDPALSKPPGFGDVGIGRLRWCQSEKGIRNIWLFNQTLGSVSQVLSFFSVKWQVRTLFFPKQCVHTGVLLVVVKAGAWSGCSSCAITFFL